MPGVIHEFHVIHEFYVIYELRVIHELPIAVAVVGMDLDEWYPLLVTDAKTRQLGRW